LTSQIEVPRPEKYDGVFGILSERDFVWIVPNDDNRIADALDLRRKRNPDEQWGPATVLEVLVALSQRMEFNAGGVARQWAWKFIENLGLDEFPDPVLEHHASQIQDVLDGFIWRKYDPNGSGGLFPLNHAKEDQTKVELWYQMHAYIIENDLI
jgi:hypothetical protein